MKMNARLEYQKKKRAQKDAAFRSVSDPAKSMEVLLRMKNSGVNNPAIVELAEAAERQGFLDTEQHRDAMWLLMDHYDISVNPIRSPLDHRCDPVPPFKQSLFHTASLNQPKDGAEGDLTTS